MRRRTTWMIISGALLSGTSLLIFNHLLDQRSSNDLRRQNDRIARRLCTALQGVEHSFASPGPPMASLGLQSVAEAELAQMTQAQLVKQGELARKQQEEMRLKRIPLTVTRSLPNASSEEWSANDLSSVSTVLP